jgi:hypothetical protein
MRRGAEGNVCWGCRYQEQATFPLLMLWMAPPTGHASALECGATTDEIAPAGAV